MISSIEWIPAGIADPNPKKYELSSTEQELIQMIDEHGNFVTSSSTDVTDDNARNPNKEVSRISRNTRNNNTTKTQLPKMEHNLPPDLRMDEYSDDDDDEADERRTATIGRLLVSDGNDDNDQRMEDEYINDVDEQNVLKDIDDDHGIAQNDHDHDDDADRDANKRNDPDNDDDDDDDDDDLADVPDTREYEPVDVEGLEAMGFGGVTANFHGDDAFHDDNDDDDESELEDVALTPDDALVLVAKTEDVRMTVCVEMKFLGLRLLICPFILFYFVCRILLHWKYTSMIKRMVTYLYTMISRYRPFHYAWHMDR